MKSTAFHAHQNQFKLLLTFIAVISLAVVTIPTLATPTPKSEKRYIVVLKDTVNDARSVASKHVRDRGAKVSRTYNTALKGYSAEMTSAQASALTSDPQVAFVEEDGLMSADTTQATAPWGLDRIDQTKLPLSKTYSYASTGKGVTAYIIDSGVLASNVDFGGRVTEGFDAVDGSLPAEPCNGHGTHVAGILGGNKYGVAKNVSMVSVRVLGCDNFGYWSWIIAGIDYVTAMHQPGQPAVANLSIGGGISQAVDTAVKNSIADGVSYAISAGNSTANACNASPARVPEAMTIGATDQTDNRASWSNFGNCVDWFAPGANIMSDWNTGDTATTLLSGTSMAAPHTAGVAALYLQKYPRATPLQVRNALNQITAKNVVKNSRSSSSNLLFTNY